MHFDRRADDLFRESIMLQRERFALLPNHCLLLSLLSVFSVVSLLCTYLSSPFSSNRCRKSETVGGNSR